MRTRILEWMKAQNRPVMSQEIVQALGLNRFAVTRYLALLARDGQVKDLAVSHKTAPKLWGVPEVMAEVMGKEIIPNPSNFHGEGIEGLMAATLEQARKDLKTKGYREDALYWFTDPRDEVGIFSFRSVCRHLNLSPEAVYRESVGGRANG